MPDPIASTFASRFRRPVPDPEASDIERPGRVLRFWSLLPVALAFALFGAVVWLAYQDTSLAPPVGEPPLIKAAADPYKLPPDETEETTSGAEDGNVGRLWSDADQTDQPERLLPTPETPLSPPPMEEPATADATLESGSTPSTTVTRSARPPAAEAAAGAAAGDTTAAAAPAEPAGAAQSTPAQPADAAQSAGAPPASEESLREAEAALDRLLAEVTAMSDDTDTPAAAAATPAETAVPPPSTAEDQARIEPRTPPRREPAAPAAPPASTATAAAPAAAPPPASAERAPSASTAAAAPAAPAPPAPTERAPAPVPEVRPAAATTAAAPAAEPRRAPTQTAATAAQAAVRRPSITPDGAFRIQLAAVRGEADARRAWQLFMADLGPVLTDVEPIFERAETANGVFYRVQVGPFASQETADDLCEQFKQRNASCFVIRR